jgi:hypothetical protein
MSDILFDHASRILKTLSQPYSFSRLILSSSSDASDASAALRSQLQPTRWPFAPIGRRMDGRMTLMKSEMVTAADKNLAVALHKNLATTLKNLARRRIQRGRTRARCCYVMRV